MIHMEQNKVFEKNKNIQASLYTAGVVVILFLLLFFVSWSLPALPEPEDNGGVEVNLGNSDQGLGDDAPLVPGTPSNEEFNNYNPAPTSGASAQAEPEVAENNDPDATVINTSKEQQKNQAKNNNSSVVKNKTEQPVVNSSSSTPKPKNVYSGSTKTGTGGNNSDSYNKSQNQGIAGGAGDQGKPNGNINSNNYDGNGGTGTGGISIVDGDLRNRKITSSARFEDEYKNGGKVYVNITVDPNGNVISTSVRLQGSSPFTDLQSIAKQRAAQLKFNKSDQQQSGTILIVFQNPKG
jgi:TonB family protein